MSFQALYRKYRSSTFEEVIGQPHVIQTLIAAIGSGRVSHAYLFTGPRGVGKTSVARILARAINCLGEEAKPCNKCTQCLAPISGHLDLIEIDAASNRSIDEVRDLREKISLAPASGKYKIFIIDEVHMLTKEAFNALLKTLEEPPAHAVFILATTEAHKLPETVVSRTQRFNFKPISHTDLVKGLADIAKREKVEIAEDALGIIATAGRGGFRDAISMLDQVVSLGETTIEADSVRQLLGWSDTETITELSMAIAGGNTAEALGTLDRLIEQGIQVNQVIIQLIEYWRRIMLASVGTAPAGPGEHPVEAITGILSTDQIVRVVETLTAVSKSHYPALMLEAALIKLTLPGVTAPSEGSVSFAGTTPVSRPVAASGKENVASAASPAPSKDKSSGTTQGKGAPGENDKLWMQALMLIKQRNNSLYALIRSCEVDIDGAKISLSCRFSFHRDRLTESKNRQVIEEAAGKVFNRKFQVEVVQIAPTNQQPPQHPATELVGSALEILGGEIVEE